MRLSGVARMILASMFLSANAALVKWVAPRVPTFEIILFRCALPVPLLIWWVRRRGLPVIARNRRLMLVRALSGVAAMSLFFWALGRLPLADTMLLSRMQPVIVAVLAPLLLSERGSRTTLFSIVLSLAGVALILQPTFDVGNLAGLAAVGAALASAIAHMALRRQSAHDDSMVIVLNFIAVTTFVALPIAAIDPVVPIPTDGLALAGIAVLATVGQLLLTGAYAVEEAPVVAAASYALVAFAVLWGFLFWGEIPAPLVWAGGALVVNAGLLLLWSRRGHPARAYQPPGGSG